MSEWGVLVLLFSIFAPVEVHALAIPVAGWGYTVGYGIGRGIGLNPRGVGGITGNGTPGTGWSIWWDPPVSLIRGRVVFEYDPSLITVIPEASGFVGVFSDNPAIDMPFDQSC